jgi:hypothetical protein
MASAKKAGQTIRKLGVNALVVLLAAPQAGAFTDVHNRQHHSFLS